MAAIRCIIGRVTFSTSVASSSRSNLQETNGDIVRFRRDRVYVV